ncbi:MAG: hypothetical protein OXJ38_03010 [Gammaproteobacteria bacterium]|nr:hypothetical protein [Gammaproteobacteria bacterium]
MGAVFNAVYSAPADVARRLLVEIGLEGLVKKFEEVIGKRPVQFVIWLAFVAFGLWLVKLIMQTFSWIFLEWAFLEDPAMTNHLLMINSVLRVVVWGSVAALFVWGYYKFREVKSKQKELDKVQEEIRKDMKKAIDDLLSDIDKA